MSRIQNTYVAIVPARAGSKRLPAKNTLLLAGKPMIEHTISAAIESARFSSVYLTTDDESAIYIGEKYDCEIIKRPSDLAHDRALSSDVVRHALEKITKDAPDLTHFVLLQPTSPLRDSAHIIACIDQFEASSAQCALSVCEVEHHPFKQLRLRDDGRLEPLFGIDNLQAPQQSLPKIMRQNGAIYIMPIDVFLSCNAFFTEDAFGYVMPVNASVDVDEKLDFLLCEMLLKERNKP